jgi:hypothetical protein
LTAKKLFQPQLLADNTDDPLYTVPGKVKSTIIKKLTFYNGSGGTRVVSVYLVPLPTDGSPPATAPENQLSAHSIDAGATWECTEAVNQLINMGDCIFAGADAASDVTAMATGIEILNLANPE